MAISHYRNLPFEIPENWVWTTLGDLCNYGKCHSINADHIPSNGWILDLEDIEKDTGRLLVKVHKDQRATTSSKHIFKEGNVLYSKLRTYLNKVVIAEQDGYCTSEIIPLDFGCYVNPEYARYVLMSNMYLRYTALCGYGVKMPRLGTNDGRRAPFPLPPLKEQNLIVNKIEQTVEVLSKVMLELLH